MCSREEMQGRNDVTLVYGDPSVHMCNLVREEVHTLP